MWKIDNILCIEEFLKVLVKTPQNKLKRLRFIVRKDKMIYLATFDTFGDVMPQGLTKATKVEIWKMGT